MVLTRVKKQKILEDLKEKIERQKIIIFVDFTGLKVKDFFGLRKKLKTIEGELKVVKKTLIEIAFKTTNLNLETKKMIGEIALVFGYKDQISPAKILWQFSQENPNLKILGGFFENQFREAEEIITLATLPNREELLAKLIRSISTPITNFVNVLEGNIKGLIYVLNNLKTQMSNVKTKS